MVTLSPFDTALILLYFAAVLFVGYRSARKTTNSEEDYLLAGRSLTLPVFVMTLVSTWYGGILGVGEFTFRYGISNWLVMGLPYYVFAALFAVFLAKRIRATNLFSIPDKLEASYDRKTALLGALLTFILMTPAPYVLMLSVFLQILFGWSMPVSVIVTATVALSYLYLGGFRSDIATDVLEFVLMFLGFAVVLPFAMSQFGGIDFLVSRLPGSHLIWHGGHSVQFVLAWFLIALWTLVDPAFHQRCYAAKDGTVAQRGVVVSIGFWMLFDAMTLTAGLYARASMPGLEQPMMSFPMLGELVLPAGAKAIFYIGMLATIMSTLNTLGFVSAQTLGRDFFLRLKTPKMTQGDSFGAAARYTKAGLVISFLLSVALAFGVPSVVELWYTIGTVAIPGLLVPLVASYFEALAISASYAYRAMFFGWIVSLGWLIAGHATGLPGRHLLGIEPMFPGLAISLVWWMVGRIDTCRSRSTG